MEKETMMEAPAKTRAERAAGLTARYHEYQSNHDYEGCAKWICGLLESDAMDLSAAVVNERMEKTK